MITANQDKIKKGFTREDGMVFWCYNKFATNGQTWITKEKYQIYTERNKEKNRIQYKLKPQKKNLKNKEWYSKNKDRKKIVGYKWVEKNRNVVRKIALNHYYRNHERSLILSRQNCAKRRARITDTKELTENQRKIILCFYESANRLKNRIGIDFHVDHIIPLCWGGMHHPKNLQVIPATINLKKQASKVFVWAKP